MSAVRRFLEHPLTVAGIGLMLFVGGLSDLLEQLDVDHVLDVLGVHHGILIAGLSQTLRAFIDMSEGASRLSEQGEEG